LAGATEIGVYINKQHRRYPLLVSTEGVRELAAIEKLDHVVAAGFTAIESPSFVSSVTTEAEM